LEVFTRLYDSLSPAFYGLRTTVLSLILLALLRIKCPENLKEYSPEQLGRLLGLDRMAEVKTLRRKLTLLAKRGKGRELMNELARLRLSQDEDRLAFLYVDGHIREYSGQEALAKAKKAQRAVATTAATDTWLHDADGAPLLVVTSEMNAGLTQVLEAIVTDAKGWLPVGQRLTVLFDRGGWSVKLFARLQAQGVDIITYRKGKRQAIARSHFSEHKVSEDGQEKTYWLYDQPRVRVGRLRPSRKKRRAAGEPEYLWLRQITVLREDGRQTVIVTSRTDLPAAEVVRRLFRRWRQENYFKYMAEEFALDALAEYGVEDVSEESTRPNPERKRVAREGQQAKAEVLRLRGHLGAEVEANAEQQRPTMRGFKVAQSRLRQELAQAELRVEELREQERQLPKRVPGKGLKRLKEEKKLIVDAIKMIAFQCETDLLERLRPHYARTEDEGRTLLHAAFQASARMEVLGTELHITLAAPSSPHRGVALAKVCQELDAEGYCYPGSGLRIRLAITGPEPLTE
jgi:Transposase protein